MAAAILTVWRDGTLREAMRQDGLARAAQFSWTRAAEQTLALYARTAQNFSES
jgi:glycosyltransferase involved in cell wall biosynthesis